MAWLVEQKVAPCQGSRWIERTYDEHVTIVDGRGLVEHQGTLNFLHSCGYDVVRDLPPLDELEQHPALCAELAAMGLGPWAGKLAEEVAAPVGTAAT